mgnify:FL=1
MGQFDTIRRSNFPFNFGWGDHLPWSNGFTFWRYNGGRNQIKVADANVPFMLCYDFSVTKGRQIIFLNASSLYNHTRSSGTNIGGAFTFPDIGRIGGSTDGTEWTLGEIIVKRGMMEDFVRQEIEGYLAHKWGINNLLSNSHPFKSSTLNDSYVWKDKSLNKNHAFSDVNPSLVANAQNSLAVMSYDANQSDYHEWQDITDIRTVFSVVDRTDLSFCESRSR